MRVGRGRCEWQDGAGGYQTNDQKADSTHISS
jgi:hypothetical protein